MTQYSLQEGEAVDRAIRLASAGLLTVQFIMIWTTFFILSSAINWPASLDDPASIALPRLLEHEHFVLTGYSFYLIAALLIIPATAAMNARLKVSAALGGLTMSLATVSAICKAIGIARWLFAMPNLARDYLGQPANHETVSTLYTVLNDYAGGIGEIVGVGLVSGAWTIAIGLLVARKTQYGSRFVGGFLIVTGTGLLTTILSGFDINLGPLLTISNIAWQFSLLFLAFWALRTPPAESLSGRRSL